MDSSLTANKDADPMDSEKTGFREDFQSPSTPLKATVAKPLPRQKPDHKVSASRIVVRDNLKFWLQSDPVLFHTRKARTAGDNSCPCD